MEKFLPSRRTTTGVRRISLISAKDSYAFILSPKLSGLIVQSLFDPVVSHDPQMFP
jgi:hypothetical protein